MLALAFLTVVRTTAIGGRGHSLDLKADLLPLTIPEIRRLLARLAGWRDPAPKAVLSPGPSGAGAISNGGGAPIGNRRPQTDNDRL